MTKILKEDDLITWFTLQTNRYEKLCKAGIDKGKVCLLSHRIDEIKFDSVPKTQKSKFLNKTISICREYERSIKDKAGATVLNDIITFVKTKAK